MYSFLFCGLVCLIAEVILDNTKLTSGHITTMFVVLGVLLDFFNIYDNIIIFIGYGALVPITSFGHSLIHASISKYKKEGLIGLFLGTLDLTTPGIVAVIVFSCFLSLIFKPKD